MKFEIFTAMNMTITVSWMWRRFVWW